MGGFNRKQVTDKHIVPLELGRLNSIADNPLQSIVQELASDTGRVDVIDPSRVTGHCGERRRLDSMRMRGLIWWSRLVVSIVITRWYIAR